MGRALDRRGRIGRNDLADHQVIKEHLDGGQVLLDRLRRAWVLFDIGRDVHRRDQPNVVNVLLGPRQKLSAGPCVSLARVQVPDPGREKLEELGCGVFARVGQDRRARCGRGEGSMRSFWRQRVSNAGVLTGVKEVHFLVPYRCIKDVMIQSWEGIGDNEIVAFANYLAELFARYLASGEPFYGPEQSPVSAASCHGSASAITARTAAGSPVIESLPDRERA